MKKWKLCYIMVFIVLCLVPFAGLLLPQEESTTENRTLSKFPSLQKEEGWNTGFLTELGDYFQDHFAFRSAFVTVDARLQSSIGKVSAADGVILGTDGWLYYKDSLNDFQGTEQLSDRALFDIAHSLAMIQNSVTEQGIDFVFTIAPNKNTLYGEHMTYYFKKQASGETNLSRIKEVLAQEGVCYADLRELFQQQKEVLYHKRDSHWNNKGAALAADALMSFLGKEHKNYEGAEYVVRNDFEGDLDKMLYPAAVKPEDEIYYDPAPEYVYTEDVESNFEPQIHTESLMEGSLVMYRDSFGNALLPFMAEAYGTAYFSRGVPYQLTDLAQYQADTLIIERAERFLPDMAVNPPVMNAGLYLPNGEETVIGEENLSEIKAEATGQDTKISGIINNSCLKTDSRIIVETGDGNMYEAFPVCDGDGREGFVLYLKGQESLGNEKELKIYQF